MMIVKGGPNICGAPIGVVALDSRFPKPPGHIKNPRSLPFPVLYSSTVKGATVARLLHQPNDEMRTLFVEAAVELERQGAAAITGSCGFMALFQRELAEAVSVPVFSSSLIQVPLVRAMLHGGRTIGVMTASAQSLTPAHFEAVGADIDTVEIVGMDDYREFREVILEAKRDDMDLDVIEAEMLDAARQLVSRAPDLGAVVLECTDMPHFAHQIQSVVQVPIFDLTTMAAMIADAVCRQDYRLTGTG